MPSAAPQASPPETPPGRQEEYERNLEASETKPRAVPGVPRTRFRRGKPSREFRRFRMRLCRPGNPPFGPPVHSRCRVLPAFPPRVCRLISRSRRWMCAIGSPCSLKKRSSPGTPRSLASRTDPSTWFFLFAPWSTSAWEGTETSSTSRPTARLSGRWVRVLKPGGHLIFSTTITRARPAIGFNAHRIYSYEMLREFCAGLRSGGREILQPPAENLLPPGRGHRRSPGLGRVLRLLAKTRNSHRRERRARRER